MERVAEPLGADLVPLGGVSAEEGIAFSPGRLALLENGGQAVGVGFGLGVIFQVGAGDLTKLTGGVVGGRLGKSVVGAGAVTAGVGQTGVAEVLEMAGDGGLRQFEDFGQFADGKARDGPAAPVGLRGGLQKPYDTQPDRVGQGAQQLYEVPGVVAGRSGGSAVLPGIAGRGCHWQ